MQIEDMMNSKTAKIAVKSWQTKNTLRRKLEGKVRAYLFVSEILIQVSNPKYKFKMWNAEDKASNSPQNKHSQR